MRYERFVALAMLVCIGAAPARGDHAKWNRFTPISATIAGKRVALAAILVPVDVRLAGRDVRGWMQLDTGANTSVLYGGSLRRVFGKKFHIPQDSSHLTQLHGTVFGTPFDLPYTFVNTTLDEGDEDNRPVIGTLGADFFEHHIVALDLTNNHIALAESLKNLPVTVSSFAPMTFVTKGNVNKMVVIMTMGAHRFRAFYDSGSSAFDAIMMPKAWASMTGRSPTNRRNISATIMAWGRKSTMVGAPAVMPVMIGPVVIRHPIIYLAEGSDAQEGIPPFDGFFGNAAFVGKGILIVDVPDSKFAFVPRT